MTLFPHILRKDLRHFYPEVLLHLALLIAFASLAPRTWDRNAVPNVNVVPYALLQFFIPLLWLVLVSRVVHEEGLVGDRQFWVTRPYPWITLLLEKVVFLLLFLLLPVMLMQIVLLQVAGLLSVAVIPDLLQYQATIALLYLLPFVAIATVTATFGRLLLTLLAGGLYLALVGALAGWLTPHEMPFPQADYAIAGALLLALTAAVVLMYARRPVLRVRFGLLAVPVALFLFYLLAPSTLLIHHAYAASAGSPAFAFDPSPTQQQTGSGGPQAFDQDVLLQLPVHFTPANPGQQEFHLQGVQLAVRGPGNLIWLSPYQTADAWFTTTYTQHLNVFLPAAVYNKVSTAPVELTVQLALQPDTFGPPQAVRFFTGRFSAVPGHGLCIIRDNNNGLRCRYPFRNAPPSSVTFQVQDAPCPRAGQTYPLLDPGLGYENGLRLGLDPIVSQNFSTNRMMPGANGRAVTIPHYLCDGTQSDFALRRPADPQQQTLVQRGVDLSHYVIQRNAAGPQPANAPLED